MHQVIARTWRPQRFSDVVGQRHITQTLQNALRLNRVAHGYVFSGQRGVGKTTTARLLAKALNCRAGDVPQAEPCGLCESCQEITQGRSVDVIEIDAASNRGIDSIRELRENVRYAPARDRYKVFIIDEAHQITPEGFNALLKTLEEPPPHVVFILATTELHELPETILSRCQHFNFHSASFSELLENLSKICAAEGVQVDNEALAALASAAGGSLRDAQSRLEQALAAFGSQLEGAAVLRLLGAVPSQRVEEVFQAVEGQRREEILSIVARLVNEGYQLPHFCSQLVRTVRNILVVKLAGPQPHLLEASPEEASRLVELAAKFSQEDLMRFLDILLELHQQLRHAMEPRFTTELGLLKLVEAGRLVAIEELLDRAGSGAGVSREGERRPPAASNPGPIPAATPTPSASISPPSSTGGGSPQAPARAPALSPFEQDSLRKRSLEPQSSVAVAPPQEPLESLAPGTAEPAVAEAVATQPDASGHPVKAHAELNIESHVEPHSRENNWKHEVLSDLEQMGKIGLVCMLDGAEWEFGESEVRLRLAGAGMAQAMPAQDRAKLETILSEKMGRRIRLSLAEGETTGAATARGRGAAKQSAKSPSKMPARVQSGGDPEAEAKVRQDPELREYEDLFGKPVSGIRRMKE